MVFYAAMKWCSPHADQPVHSPEIEWTEPLYALTWLLRELFQDPPLNSFYPHGIIVNHHTSSPYTSAGSAALLLYIPSLLAGLLLLLQFAVLMTLVLTPLSLIQYSFPHIHLVKDHWHSLSFALIELNFEVLMNSDDFSIFVQDFLVWDEEQIPEFGL